MVVSEIRDFGSCTDIHMIAYDRISDIREVSYRRVICDICIFTFDECSYLRHSSYACISSYIRMRSDYRSFSEVHIPFDICPRLQYDSLFDIYISFDYDAIFDDSSHIYSFTIASYDSIICLQNIPWISYRDPATFCFYDRIFHFAYILTYQIRDLELSSWRERKLFEISEDRGIELMVADIREIAERYISRLLHDVFRLTI